MKEKQKKNKKPISNRAWSAALICMVVMISFSNIKNLIKNITTDKSDYKIRYETSDEQYGDSDKKDLVDIATEDKGNSKEEKNETNNQQKLYCLYINDIYCKDVDINNYSYVDSNGNTDYKYCALTEDANNLTCTLLLMAMITLIILIAKDSFEKTPFTHANVNRIKAIAILQLLFAALPGMVTFVMTMARFLNCHGTFNIRWFYPFIISVITALIANVFQYGVKLQEDSDSIA